MRQTRPRALGGRRARQLLSKARALSSPGARVELLSRLLLGRPYEVSPLIGSAERPEVFTASLERFDCVTYLEAVLALSHASRESEFLGWLKRIRYEDGRVEWTSRHHYMTSWIRGNTRAGTVRPVGAGLPTTRKERLLDAVDGLPPVRVRFSCVPKARMKKLESSLQTGDLIFFASTRPHLDVFHCGILVRDGDRWLLRHAARSQQSVVEQDLHGFLKGNRMAGVIVVRPVEAERAGAGG